jgi:hypothetical protein
MKRWFKFDKGDGVFKADVPFQYEGPEYENMVIGTLYSDDLKNLGTATASKFALVPVGRLSLKLVNEYIQIKYPEISLAKDNGFFYIYSDNDAVALKLAGLGCTSIGVCHLNHGTIKQWREWVESALNDSQRNELEREPVYPL